jgi:putative tryptophan/tyrosine transport system substrate-binding protein
MKRREFLGVLGSAAAWPVVARGQPSVTPVIGLLHGGTRKDYRTAAFLGGLSSAGLVEGNNVAIEYRWGGDGSQWPALAADLVRHRVNVIVAQGSPAAVAAKSATAGIPVVFLSGGIRYRLGWSQVSIDRVQMSPESAGWLTH